MSIFDLRQTVIDEYSKYVQSFLSIANEQVGDFIEKALIKRSDLASYNSPIKLGSLNATNL